MARGPAYPYIDLETAVGLTRKTYDFSRRSMVPVESVIKEAWNYSPTSSSGIKIFAAMKYYGLVEANEAGTSMRLSERGYRIVVDDEASEDRKQALVDAVLAPRWYRFCYETWGADPPPSAKRILIFDHNFVETTVDGFLRDYRKSVLYSGISSNGSESDQNEERDRKQDIVIPPNDADIEPVRRSILGQRSSIGVNMRQEVFSLAEGTVAIEWPGNLSPESFQDLSDWLDILKRKIARAAKQADSERNTGGKEAETTAQPPTTGFQTEVR